MRYFFVSDLHGCAPGLVDITLKNQGFDFNKDTLVVLGDIVDRGHFVRQLIEYLLNIPHCIAVIGNHDLRDCQLLRQEDGPHSYDYQNGVGNTFGSLLGYEPEDCTNELYHKTFLINNPTDQQTKNNIQNFFKYMNGAVWGLEFPDLIAVHGWVPVDRRGNLVAPDQASPFLWEDATWCNTQDLITTHTFPQKRMIVGHWHAWRLRAVFEKHKTPQEYLKIFSDFDAIDFSIYETAHYIAIDTCTTLSHKINVYVYETEAEPLIYTTGAVMPLSQWRERNG